MLHELFKQYKKDHLSPTALTFEEKNPSDYRYHEPTEELKKLNENLKMMKEHDRKRRIFEDLYIGLRIVDFLLDNPQSDFSRKEVIEALGMNSSKQYFRNLEEYGIVKITRKIGRTKLYKVNLENPLVKTLREYEKQISMKISEILGLVIEA